MSRTAGLPRAPRSPMSAAISAVRAGGAWPREGQFPDPSFPLAVLDVPHHPNLLLHRHDKFAELVIVAGGAGEHVTETARTRIQRGDVWYVPADMAHGYAGVCGLHLVNVVFEPEPILGPMQDVEQVPGYNALFRIGPHHRGPGAAASPLRLAGEDLTHALVLCEKLARLAVARKPGYAFMARAVFMELVWRLCDGHAQAAQPRPGAAARMDTVINHIEAHFGRPVDLEELADIAGVSKRNLHILFRQATGRTPIEYLIRLRIARASELLCGTGASITDIAYQVGFSDSNYFSRQFKRIAGMAPSAYRKSFG